MEQSEAPGAKTPENCPWWACFRADQGQKSNKTAPGGQTSSLTRGKKLGKSALGEQTSSLTRADNSANLHRLTWHTDCLPYVITISVLSGSFFGVHREAP